MFICCYPPFFSSLEAKGISEDAEIESNLVIKNNTEHSGSQLMVLFFAYSSLFCFISKYCLRDFFFCLLIFFYLHYSYYKASKKPLPILLQNRVPGLDNFSSDKEKFMHDLSLRPDESEMDEDAYER